MALRKLRLPILLFFLAFFITILQLLTPLSFVYGQTEALDLQVTTNRMYYLRGEVCGVHINGPLTTNFTLSVYKPDQTLFFEKNYTLEDAGGLDINLPIPQNTPFGVYKFEAKNQQGLAECYADILDTTGLTLTSFPFQKQHKGINYTITAKRILAQTSKATINFSYPDLPISFDSVTPRANDVMLTIRIIKNDVTIDLTYAFIYAGLKIIVNGSVPNPQIYRFQFDNAQALKKRFASIREGDIVFEFSDLIKVGEAFEYHDHVLSIYIPRNFRIDPVLFQDGFESNDFSQWTGTSTGSGESASIDSTNPKEGTYHAVFECNGGGTDYAYAYQTLGSTYSELWARAYFYFDTTALQDNNDRVWLIRFKDADSATTPAFGGFCKISGSIKWVIQEAKGFQKDYASSGPSAGQYYCVELYWLEHATAGIIRMWVDGVLACELTGLDTNDWGDVQEVRMGSALTDTNDVAIKVDVDNCVIDDEYVGTLPPSVDGYAITDMDDTDNLYAQKTWYSFTANISELDGYAQIDYVDVWITKPEHSHMLKMNYTQSTDTFAIVPEYSYGSMDVENCVSSGSGTDLDLTWKFKLDWDAVEDSDFKIQCQVWDDDGNTEAVAKVYCDIVTNLLTTFSIDDDRGDISQSITASGNVRYANDPNSGTQSSSYPPDAEFTSISVYDSSNNNEGTDSTIVSGAWSVTFNAPASVGNDTYNLFVDMVDAEYSDGEETSPTDTFITDNFVVSDKGVTDDRTSINEYEQYWFTLRSEYDSTFMESGTVTLNGSLSASWVGENSRWEYNATKATQQKMTLYVASINWDTYGVTSLSDQSSNTTSIIWDNILVTFEVNATNPTVGDTVLFTVTLTREYDSSNVTSFSYSIDRNSTAFGNPHTTTTFTDTNNTAVTFVYDFTAVTDNTYGITVFTDPSDVTVTWSGQAPTIGEFDATSRIYGNDYGRLNVTIVDQDNNITAGTITFVNCTLQISGQIIFLWDNATGTFSIYQDTYSYATLDTSACSTTTLNITAYRLSWYVKFGNGYAEGYKGAIATNTLVYDNTDLSGSGSQSNYFFYDKEEASQGGPQIIPTPPVEQPENFTWGELPWTPTEPYVAPTGPPLQLGLWGLIAIVGGIMVLGLGVRYTKPTKRSTKKRTRQKRSNPQDYGKRTKRRR